ncbi:MAG: hypothetical protein AB9869_20230 [Verrucomicrobiia bacterium]
MNTLIRKEVRLLFPAWALTMVVLVGTMLVAPMEVLDSLLFVLFALGAIFLALLPFGMEFSLGTFSSLLVQPTTRQRLWRIKAWVLAVALLSILTVMVSGYSLRVWGYSLRLEAPTFGRPADVEHFVRVCGLTALSAYAGGLWTTLLLRQISAAFWFTLLVPPAILVVVFTLPEQYGEADTANVITWLLVIYGAGATFWARRLFVRAQDVQWTGGEIALPGFLWRRPVARKFHARRPRRALFWKEIQAHQSSLVIAGGLLVLHITVLFARSAPRPDSASTLLYESFWILWLALPLLIGSSSVAEERRLGTHEEQLSLPVRRRTQLAIKLAVALLLGVFLGGCAPWLIESAAQWLGAGQSPYRDSGPSSMTNGVVLCGLAAWITLIAFHTSTLARNTLQAAGLGAVWILVLTVIAQWAASEPPLIAWIGAPILLLTLLVLAFRNFRHSRPPWTAWVANVAAVAFALALSIAASAAVHARVWELATRFEPAPGPDQVTGPIRPQVIAFRDMFVLLPDGRLWAAADYEDRPIYSYRVDRTQGRGRVTETYFARVPTAGTFIGGSNWVKIAGTYAETVGLQSDGSLWRLYQSEAAEQIWSESRWTDISAGFGFFVALKDNGTLWGWGYNHTGQLGPGEKVITGDPVQIGKDDDWKAVFPAPNSCIGVKKNGSVWRWGQLAFTPQAFTPQGWNPRNPARDHPIEWPLNGSDWLDVKSIGALDLILRQDGTLWASGYLPRRLLGMRMPSTRFSLEAVQVGGSSDWLHLDRESNSIVAVNGGEILFQAGIHRSSVPWIPDVWRPSRRSDWITATVYGTGGCLALAKDGTLAAWGHPAGPPAGFSGLLAPSRKPLWAVNLLTGFAPGGPAR